MQKRDMPVLARKRANGTRNIAKEFGVATTISQILEFNGVTRTKRRENTQEAQPENPKYVHDSALFWPMAVGVDLKGQKDKKQKMIKN